MAERPRIFLADSYDDRARLGVVMAELRGSPSKFWEKVVKDAPTRSARIEFGLEVARLEQLRDVDLFLTDRSNPQQIEGELGLVRVRWVHRRKNWVARSRAHRSLRRLVPGPKKEPDDYSLADYGVDLEIARLEADGDPSDEGDPPF